MPELNQEVLATDEVDDLLDKLPTLFPWGSGWYRESALLCSFVYRHADSGCPFVDALILGLYASEPAAERVAGYVIE